MSKLLSIALLSAGLCVMSSCTEPITANQNLYITPQVSISDYWLREDLSVTVQQPQRVGAGQLKVPIEIRNNRDWELHLDYSYSFVDKGGTQVDSPTAYEFLRIPPRGSAQIAPTSLSAMAADFHVFIRRAK